MTNHRVEKVITEVLGEEIALTPSDLVSKTIKRQAMGGYDTDAVDDLLELAAEALEKLSNRVRELKAANEEQRAELAEYREVESSLRNALMSSQRFGDDIVENAKREADLILREARLAREEINAEAARIPEAITRDIRVLMDERDRLREDVLATLEAHRLWVEERIPARDAALSERLLAFVNAHQVQPRDEIQSALRDPGSRPLHDEDTQGDEEPDQGVLNACSPEIQRETDGASDMDEAPEGGEPHADLAEEHHADTDHAEHDDGLPDVVLGPDHGPMHEKDDHSGVEVLEAVAEDDDTPRHKD